MAETIRSHHRTAAQAAWGVAGYALGAGLSFLAFGLLWIGAPWGLQFGMALPFLLAGYLVRRLARASHPVPVGMLPLCALIVQFRDRNDAHAMSIALVATWLLAVGAGVLLARRREAQADADGDR